MNYFRNIFFVLLAVIFLIPAAGFHYTKHTCLESGKVQFTLNGEYACCEVESETCCQEESHEDCCVNNTNYLKTEADYTSPEKVKLPKIEFQLTLAFHTPGLFPEFTLVTQERAHPSPDLYGSRELLIQHGIFLI